MGRRLDTDGISGPALRQRREPALGRRRLAVPVLHQLHDGLPHLLLHHGRGRHRPHRRVRTTATASGTPASTRTSPYIHGGTVRASTRSRYRQWMTHKLASWHDQFGSSGCVGCGRCVTWCPAAIDITRGAALRAPRSNAGARPPRAAPAQREPLDAQAPAE